MGFGKKSSSTPAPTTPQPVITQAPQQTAPIERVTPGALERTQMAESQSSLLPGAMTAEDEERKRLLGGSSYGMA